VKQVAAVPAAEKGGLMEIGEAVQAIAKQYGVSAAALESVLAAMAMSAGNNKNIWMLARAMRAKYCGRATFNFDHGRITDDEVITSIEAMVRTLEVRG